MRSALWLLFALGIAVNVWSTTFADLGTGAEIAAKVASGVLVLGSGTGLWLTRPNRHTA
ncbi:hypothetical protein [Streptomyces sp. CAU 1734]|uniref:hypothetical protein n=1 Tax=Streptomyces sp. CAU 1734 TaxID=3140360 RepID=UPI00325FE9AE